MTKKSGPPPSSQSNKRIPPVLSVATLALGEKLVTELKLNDSTDTLARWMAHYVAELMLRAEHAPLPNREETERACASAILDLWAQTRSCPTKSTAFESIDRVIECMDSLHPEAGPHYRNKLWRALEARTSDDSTEIDSLLKSALWVDAAARNLIHHLLAHASHVAGRDNAEWLELAQNLDEDDPVTGLRIRIVRAGQEEMETKNHRIEQLEKRIEQLEHFSVAAQALKTDLEDALAAAKDRPATKPH
ncbi:AVAST type 3 anti-phage proein Avs3b [Pseudomonas sp. NyZ201]|uniref:AVAST type 3 anti-phage proein Avs3b n=1 Tax=Pseudomonas sp. NyZ201 TaxID=3409857 RepID=UPI003CF98A0B